MSQSGGEGPVNLERRVKKSNGRTEITTETVLKQNANCRIEREVEAMRYVQKHISIPIYHMSLSFNWAKVRSMAPSILMERMGVGGIGLDSAWSKMESNVQAQTISQLKSYFLDLGSYMHFVLRLSRHDRS